MFVSTSSFKGIDKRKYDEMVVAAKRGEQNCFSIFFEKDCEINLDLFRKFWKTSDKIDQQMKKQQEVIRKVCQGKKVELKANYHKEIDSSSAVEHQDLKSFVRTFVKAKEQKLPVARQDYPQQIGTGFWIAGKRKESYHWIKLSKFGTIWKPKTEKEKQKKKRRRKISRKNIV